jgi:hypothetical protein
MVGLSNTILEWIHPIEMPKSMPIYQKFHEIEGLQMEHQETYKSSNKSPMNLDSHYQAYFIKVFKRDVLRLGTSYG